MHKKANVPNVTSMSDVKINPTIGNNKMFSESHPFGIVSKDTSSSE